MINTPRIFKTSEAERCFNDRLLQNFQLAFCARELEMVMSFLHPEGQFWSMDYDCVKPIFYKMMFSSSNGAGNLIHVKSEFVCSFDGKPGQSVLKLTFHDKKSPPYDQVSLCKRNVRKIDFEFAFRFKDGLIYEIRNSIITKTRREMEYLEQNN